MFQCLMRFRVAEELLMDAKIFDFTITEVSFKYSAVKLNWRCVARLITERLRTDQIRTEPN